MTMKTNNSTLKVYAILVGLFVLVGMILSVAVTLLAYPTQSHKDIAAKYEELNNTILSEGKFNVMETKEYTQLRDHPDTVYSNTVNGYGVMVQLVVWLAMVTVMYYRLRQYRVVKNPVSTIAVAETIAVTLTAIPITAITTMYTGIPSPFNGEIVPTIAVAVGTILVSFFMTWLVATIVQWNYNRTHGFIED